MVYQIILSEVEPPDILVQYPKTTEDPCTHSALFIHADKRSHSTMTIFVLQIKSFPSMHARKVSDIINWFLFRIKNTFKFVEAAVHC